MSQHDRHLFVQTTIQSMLDSQKTVPYRLRVLMTQYIEGDIPVDEIYKELREDCS
jgi:hypothetical protein